MIEINNQTKRKINNKLLLAAGESFLRRYKFGKKDVSLVIVGAKRMRTLNRDYRGYDKPTDVLTFSLYGQTSNENKMLGEIIINISECDKFKKYREMMGETGFSDNILKVWPAKKSFDFLLLFLFVHGLLHLAGYDDHVDADRKKMLILGRKFLESIKAC